MKIRPILSTFLFAVALMAAIPAFVLADGPSTGDSSSSAAAPSTGDSGSSAAPSTGDAGSSASPSTGTSGSSAGGSSTGAPSTGDAGSSAAPSTGSSGSSAGSTGGSSSSGSSGGSSSGGASGSAMVSSGGSSTSYGSSGGVANTANVLFGTANTTSSCPYLTGYLKLGWNNPVTEVNKLQAFLKIDQKLDVDVTGVYDAKTVAAVKAFQIKYISEIMAPWGLTVPSGQVFYTTQKKINELVCKTPFTLTAAQLAQINAYKLSLSQHVQNPTSITTPATTNTDTNMTSTTTDTTDTSIDQTGAVNNVSFGQKVWEFIKHVFGR